MEATSSPRRQNSSAFESKSLLDQGKSVEEIAKLRGVKTSRVVYHMELLVRYGHKFESSRFFSPERLEEIKQAFSKSRGWLLKPAADQIYGKGMLLKSESEKEELYTELKLARVLLRQ